jgi:hypothetical protein
MDLRRLRCFVAVIKERHYGHTAIRLTSRAIRRTCLALCWSAGRTHLGPDAQVDDGNMIISPARPVLTDPFLHPGEPGSPRMASIGTRTAAWRLRRSSSTGEARRQRR